MKRILRSAFLLLFASALLLLMSFLVSSFFGHGFAQSNEQFANFPPEKMSEKPTVPKFPDSQRILAFSTLIENQYQQITVIDTEFKSLAVYRIPLHGSSPQVEFCSMRRIRGDLELLSSFNISPDARPEEIETGSR